MKIYKSKKGGQQIRESYDTLVSGWGVETEDLWLDGYYGKTHVLAAGLATAVPILLFHGVGDDSALMWKFNAKALASRFRIYAIDVIGGPGKSEPGPLYWKGFDQMVWIKELIAGLRIEHCHAIGTSYGSWMAQAAFVAAPATVLKVVGMAGAISLSGYKGGGLSSILVFLPEALFPTRKNALKLMRKISGENFDAFLGDPALMEHWFLLLRHFNNQAMMVHKRILQFDLTQVLPLRERGLFLLGDRDPIAYRPEALRALSESGMRYEVFPKTGHGLNHERAEAVNQRILAFLGE
jgi:pimeloyl-ACP methyl ester carboxylesterase